MSKVVEMYSSLSDIGNHENHVNKVGDFKNMNVSYRVTFVSSDGGATVETKSGISPLKAGMVIGLDALVLTNSANIEITDSNETKFRLNAGSQFCIEDTIQGIRPVLYGNISVISSDNYKSIMDQFKYVTSCWNNLVTQVIECLTSTSDIYYALDSGLEIAEFDEEGNKFLIARLEPFEKCILKADYSKNMRERYTVLQLEKMSLEDLSRIYNEYIIPVRWNKQFAIQKEKVDKLG